jgi:transposase-like protein
MPGDRTAGKPTTRRYSEQEKVQAVRLVRQLRAELGADFGTVTRVAEQLGYGPRRCGSGCTKPRSTTA